MRRISHSSCRLHLSRAVRSSNTIGAVTQSETPDLGKCEPAQGLAMRAKPIRQRVTSRVEAASHRPEAPKVKPWRREATGGVRELTILAVGSRSAPPPWRWSAPNSKRPGAGTYSTNRLGALDLLRVRAVILSLAYRYMRCLEP
jgi:hypothetical protein